MSVQLVNSITGGTYTAVDQRQADAFVAQGTGWTITPYQPTGVELKENRYRLGTGLPVVASHPCNSQDASPKSDAGCTTRSRHFMTRDATGIRLMFHNFTPRDQMANPIAVNATIEAQGTSTPTTVGTLVPVFFRGAPVVTIQPGEHVVSDPIPWTFLAGAGPFWVNTHVVGVGGTQRPPGDEVSNYYASTGEWQADNDATDYATAGNYPAGAKAGFNRLGIFPTAVLGSPTTDLDRGRPLPIVAVCGDSISTNNTDSLVTDGVYGNPANPPITAKGWQGRGFSRYSNIGYINASQSGDSLVLVVASNFASYRNRLKLIQNCTHALLTLAMNDLSNAIDAPTWEGYALQWAQFMVERGVRPVITTPLAKSTTTDAWATETNQTPDAVRHAGGTMSKLETIRAWALAVPAPFVGCWDWGAAVNVWNASKNARVWRADLGALTSDGVHPNSLGHQVLAQAMPPFWTW